MFPSDHELQPLIDAMATGDDRGLRDFIDLVGPFVYGTHLRSTGQTVAAAVLTERTFAELWRSAPLYDRQFGGPRDWIMAVARLKSVDHLGRRRGNEKRLKSTSDAEEFLESYGADGLESELALPETAQALQSLSPEDRQFLVEVWRAGLRDHVRR